MPIVAAGPRPERLEVRDVKIVYTVEGRAHTAIERASFSLRDGEKLVLLGPSGCGKSTLLKTVAGFISPREGSVLVDGRPVKGPGPDRMVVFQEFDQLFPWKTVQENVAYAVRAAKGAPAAAAAERARHYLDLVGLLRFAGFYPHALSGGMKQRAAIARALAVEPEILLMDEPFGSLDAQTRTLMQEELLNIWARTRKTILFVTHSIDEAVMLGDRIVILTEGPGRVKTVIAPDEEARTPTSVHFAALCREVRSLLQVAAFGGMRS
ncbi:MAG TPA: ABC transporter ATP-binding protein [Bacillota bacterium]|jgi:NitT/TauT family transport system ATP-binding protein